MSQLPAPVEELEQRLLQTIGEDEAVMIAFSAGVDSALVAAAAYRVLGHRATAVTANSPSLPQGELAAAQAIAAVIGISHRVVETQEMTRPEYARNPVNRCYFCKTELYETLAQLVQLTGASVLFNGANLDDQGDYRPGMQAAQEFRVRSPLIEAGFRKDDVRRLAAYWKLPNWNKPAGPCLSSRIAYGVEVTVERLQRVDAAESWLRDEFGIAELRVRLEAHELARIELPPPALSHALEPSRRQRIVAEMKRLGFRYVTLDLEGFRSGSMNAVVELRLPAASRS